MSAVIYVRISRDTAGEGLGVQRQEQACRELAARLNLTVTQVYNDNDVSAWSGKNRPEYKNLLSGIRSGEVARVIVWATDRLHRSLVELEEYADLCLSHKVTTHTVQAGLLDLTSPAGLMTARILGATARYESDHKSARIKAAHAQLRASGELVGSRAFGWKLDERGRLSGELDKREARLLKDAANRILDGDSPFQIAAEWNAEGITTARGGPWTHSNLRIALTNPRICGFKTHQRQIVRDEDGQPIVGQWTPILKVGKWERVCAALDQKRHMRAGSVRHLLSGLVDCECGAPMHGQTRRNQSDLLTCSVCTTTIAQHKVMEPVINAVASAIMLGGAQGRSHTPNAHKGLSERLRDLEEAKVRLVDAVEAGVLDLKDVAARKKVIEADIAKVSKELDAALLTGSAGDVFHAIRCQLWKKPAFSDAVQAKKDIAAEFENLSFERKRALIKATMTITVKRGRGADRVAVDSLVLTDA